MTIERLLKQIEEEKIAPVYFLVGAESFFHDQVIKTLEKTLFADAGAKSLNITRLYGTENSLSEVLSAVLGYPMLVQKKLVIIKEFHKLKLTEPEALINYLKRPEQTTCLVLSCEEAPRNKTFRSIIENAEVVDCKPIPEYRMGDWLKNLSKTKGLMLEDQTAQFLIDHVGTDLLNLSMELDKIRDFKNDDSPVTLDQVSQITGIDKEASVFSLQTALANKRIKSSLRITRSLLEAGENANLIIAVLFAFFKRLLLVWQLKQKGNNRQQISNVLKLRDFQVKEMYQVTQNFSLNQLEEIIKMLAQIDSDLKSSRSDELSALQMLCYKICRN